MKLKYFLLLISLLILFSFTSFAQTTTEKYERYVGNELGKFPLTVQGLQDAFTSLNDTGVVHIAYPGISDTSGLGTIPRTIRIEGWLTSERYVIKEDSRNKQLLYFYNKKNDWQANVSSELNIDSLGFSPSSHSLSIFGVSRLNYANNYGQPVYGINGQVLPNITNEGAWDEGNYETKYGGLIGVKGDVGHLGTKGVVPYVAGVEGFWSSEAGASDSVNILNIVSATVNKWGSGATHVNRFAFFGTKLSGGTFPSNVTYDAIYNFYSDKDYPSYFGGNITQKIRTTNVSNPPTIDELDNAFPNAEDGETIYIDIEGNEQDFYQVVKDGGVWWHFKGEKQKDTYLLEGEASEIYIDNANYDWFIYRNDLPSPVREIKWDSTGNVVFLYFDDLSLNFNDYKVFPSKFTAIADTGSGNIAVLCSVTAQNLGSDRVLRFGFNYLDNVIGTLDESVLDKVIIPLDLKIIRNGTSDYQYGSTL